MIAGLLLVLASAPWQLLAGPYPAPWIDTSVSMPDGGTQWATSPDGSVQVGDLGDPPQATMWLAGVSFTLGGLGGQSSTAYAVNASHRVCGAALTPDGSSHAWQWTAGAGMSDLTPSASYALATAVSPGGIVAGVYEDGCYYWDGSLHLLGPLLASYPWRVVEITSVSDPLALSGVAVPLWGSGNLDRVVAIRPLQMPGPTIRGVGR